jgi:hypothetical protein
LISLQSDRLWETEAADKQKEKEREKEKEKRVA